MRGQWLTAASVFSLFLAGSVFACPRDGTDGACHCLEKALSRQAQAGLPVAAPAALTQQMHVFDFDFSQNPAGGMVMDAVIQVGDTVTWKWDSGFHSVTSVRGSAEVFDSGDLVAPNATFSHTFAHAGTFVYYCDIHGFDNGNGTAGGMAGTVTVLPVPEPASLGLAAAATLILLRRRRYSR